MGRRSRKRPYNQGHVPLDTSRLQSVSRIEIGPGGEEYHVRSARPSDKTFTCPGCGGTVLGSQRHLVAWPVEHLWGRQSAVESRRHWHPVCWQAAH